MSRPLSEQLPTYEQRARITELSEVMYGDGDAWLKEFDPPATRGGASQIIKVLLERPDYHGTSIEPGVPTLSPEAHAWAAQQKKGTMKDPVSEANKAKVAASVQSREASSFPAADKPPESPGWKFESARWRYFDMLAKLVEQDLEIHTITTGSLNVLLDRIERLVNVIDAEKP